MHQKVNDVVLEYKNLDIKRQKRTLNECEKNIWYILNLQILGGKTNGETYKKNSGKTDRI